MLLPTYCMYSCRGKNWPVAIKQAYKAKEKTVWQKNCLLICLYISAVHFLILGCCPLPIDHILQPPGPSRSLHPLLHRGIRTLLGKGLNLPQTPLRHVQLLPYALQGDIGLPKLNCHSLISQRKVGIGAASHGKSEL
jgi:hypothetical protein